MKNNKIILSIIIPYHNASSTILRLLNSIPERDDIDIIIIDDHSTPSEMDWCSITLPHNNLRICSLINKTNAGDARNFGMYISNSNFFLFADSDDYFSKSAFSVIFKYIKSNSYDLVIFNSKSFDENTKLPSFRDSYRRRINDCSPIEAAVISVSPWAKLIKRSVISENNIYFSNTEVANDVCFSTKLALTSNTILVDRNIIYYVSDNLNSLTAKIDKRKALIRLNEQIKKIMILQKYNMSLFKKYIFRYHNLTKFRYYAKVLNSEKYSILLKHYESLLGIRVIISHYLFKFVPSSIKKMI